MTNTPTSEKIKADVIKDLITYQYNDPNNYQTSLEILLDLIKNSHTPLKVFIAMDLVDLVDHCFNLMKDDEFHTHKNKIPFDKLNQGSDPIGSILLMLTLNNINLFHPKILLSQIHNIEEALSNSNFSVLDISDESIKNTIESTAVSYYETIHPQDTDKVVENFLSFATHLSLLNASPQNDVVDTKQELSKIASISNYVSKLKGYTEKQLESIIRHLIEESSYTFYEPSDNGNSPDSGYPHASNVTEDNLDFGLVGETFPPAPVKI